MADTFELPDDRQARRDAALGCLIVVLIALLTLNMAIGVVLIWRGF